MEYTTVAYFVTLYAYNILLIPKSDVDAHPCVFSVSSNTQGVIRCCVCVTPFRQMDGTDTTKNKSRKLQPTQC
jgi:hypothetical protein